MIALTFTIIFDWLCIFDTNGKFNSKVIIPLVYKSLIMSSIKNRGENEFADDESNIVGKSEENEEEQDQEILKTIKKEISQEEDTNN